LLKPAIGKLVVSGGVDRVYECVGSDRSLDDANRLARSGGTVVLVGLPGIAKGVDWSAIFSQELTLIANTEYGHAERFQGKTWSAFGLALDLMAKGKADLSWMVSRRYALKEYKRALNEFADKKRHPIIKAVFEFPQ
jgi:threonine dehydrogenase-like Zn-dependent dehydrogenase